MKPYSANSRVGPEIEEELCEFDSEAEGESVADEPEGARSKR
jgi:hypothetical protein